MLLTQLTVLSGPVFLYKMTAVIRPFSMGTARDSVRNEDK